MERARTSRASFVLLLLMNLSLYWLCVASEESPYSIIIDGGSTGSRLHIFESVVNETGVTLVRRGSARAEVPMSSFGRTHDTRHNPLNASYVAEHLIPTLQYAASVIPSQHHGSTRVLYQATAGMRLLDEAEQEAVYDALYMGLVESEDVVFDVRRSDIDTLSGDLEGFYGAVAANYLKGTINADLQLIGEEVHEDEEHVPVIGALDMGGSSTQLVFLPGQSRSRQDEESSVCTASPHEESSNCHAALPDELPSRLHGPDFFATSYLAYGVDQFRERLWSTWVQERKDATAYDSDDEPCCVSKVIENPCTFKGYEIEWEGYTLVGTGDAHQCIEQVQRLIPHPEEPDHDHKLGSHVGGVEHPPVRGKFFAMSLYFFTLDSLRELSHPDEEAHEALNLSWPTPSIQELFNALDGLCSRSWSGDLEDIAHTAHAYTRPHVLPYRCLESVYMVTLLRDGFGFGPESRDITFTFLVDGSEVEWTLGMALVLREQQQKHRQDAAEHMTPHEAPASSTDNSNYTFDEEEYRARDVMTGLFEELTERLWPMAS